MIQKKAGILFRFTVWSIVLAFTTVLLCSDLFRVKNSIASELGIPEPTKLLQLSQQYSPVMLRGIQIDPKDPFKFNFIVDEGDFCRGGSCARPVLEKETSKLINYFLAALATPEDNLWVNLSPYEQDRIISGELEKTDMGKDMLCQDYILKQLSSSLTHPDTATGEIYWKSLLLGNRGQGIGNSQNQKLSPIPYNLFPATAGSIGKIWIMPDKAKIYEDYDKAFVKESSLKLEAEVDFGLMAEMTDQVNNGKHFAKVRQMYNSLLLATWFKQKLKSHLVSQVYADKSKVKGIDFVDPKAKDKVYSQYIKSYTDGVYDCIRKGSGVKGQVAREKRRFFSGGIGWNKIGNTVSSALVPWDAAAVSSSIENNSTKIQIELDPSYAKSIVFTSSAIAQINKKQKYYSKDIVSMANGKKTVIDENTNIAQLAKEAVKTGRATLLQEFELPGKPKRVITVYAEKEISLSQGALEYILMEAYKASKSGSVVLPRVVYIGYVDKSPDLLAQTSNGFIGINRIVNSNDDNSFFRGYGSTVRLTSILHALSTLFLGFDKKENNAQIMRDAAAVLDFLEIKADGKYTELIGFLERDNKLKADAMIKAIKFKELYEREYITEGSWGIFDEIFEHKSISFKSKKRIAVGGNAEIFVDKKSKGNNGKIFYKRILSTNSITGIMNEALAYMVMEQRGIYDEIISLKKKGQDVAELPVLKGIGLDNEGYLYLKFEGIEAAEDLMVSDTWYDLNPAQKIKHLIKVFNLLQVFHGHKLLHNDIKPDNILLNSLRRLMLIDPMLSKTGADGLTGTGNFIPSEETRFIASDVYSASRTLWDLFFGRLKVKFSAKQKPARDRLEKLIRDTSVEVKKRPKKKPKDMITEVQGDPKKVTEKQLNQLRTPNTMQGMVAELEKIGEILSSSAVEKKKRRSWAQEEDGIRYVLDTIRTNKPWVVWQYNDIEKLNQTERELLRRDVYGISSSDFNNWDINGALDKNGGAKYFEGSHIVALQKVFKELDLDPLGFGLNWTTPENGKESVRYVLSREMPLVMEKYRQIQQLEKPSEEMIEEVRREIYTLSKVNFVAWGMGGAISKKVAPYFKGKYYEALKQSLPELKLNTLEFKLEWVAPNKQPKKS